MIHESEPWKRLLSQEADRLLAASKARRSEARSVRIERALFFGAYIIRKLAEAKKLSSAYDSKNIQVQVLPATKAGIDWTNAYRWDQFFEISASSKKTIAVSALVNLLIHSLVLVELNDEEDHVVGFFITSDQQSKTALYAVEIAAWIAVMRWVAADHVGSVQRWRAEVGGPWREKRYCGVDPSDRD